MKILKIKSCKECPIKSFSFIGYYCKMINDLLHPLLKKGVHKDCPLADASQSIHAQDTIKPCVWCKETLPKYDTRIYCHRCGRKLRL